MSIVRDGAAHRRRPPELIWAPLVRHDDAPHPSIMHVAVYASLNTAAAVRQAWGLDDGRVEAVREQLVRGDTAAAGELVPPAALDDLILESPDPAPIAAIARGLAVSSLAVPGFDPRHGRRPHRLGRVGRVPAAGRAAAPMRRWGDRLPAEPYICAVFVICDRFLY